MKKKTLHPGNECYHLLEKYKELVEKKKKESSNLLETIIQTQKKMQEDYMGADFNTDDMKKRTKYVAEHVRNMIVELSELLNKLPYREWKDYTKPETKWALSRKEYTEEYWAEIQYEWADAFHFLLNIGLMLEIDAGKAFELYITKAQENIDRQKRRY